MRNLSETGPVLRLRAIGGLHVVTLAWDFVDREAERYADLLGFAIERAELNAEGNEIERYWLRGIKRFKDKDKGLKPGTPVPTSEHPFQGFQWGDYTPKPDTNYRFRLVPVLGSPKQLVLDEENAATVEIRTEAEAGPQDGEGKPRHDIYFNRGVAGSQAYAREFPGLKPDPDQPKSKQMRWLSRGLFEALVGFIQCADGAHYGLRAMFYEFGYAPVGEAFHEAFGRGVDVAIRYEAQSYKAGNEAMIEATRIGALCEPQAVRAAIRHNKFVVLLYKGTPIAVWTGSTNISAGGIFGHSNVGHIVWDEEIARRYHEYWLRLSDPDVTTSGLRKFASGLEPTPGAMPPEDRILTLFSPRDPYNSHTSSPTLSWYADLLASAKSIACMTFAFNFDKVFEAVASGHTQAINYLVFDKDVAALSSTEIRQSDSTVVAAGATLEDGDIGNFIGERLTGFNKNRYIHDKFLLVDPLGDDPIVVTGTANFSEPSQEVNDENMLVIRGDTRVADIYFGEFMRIFDHLYSRYINAILRDADRLDPGKGYLKERMEDWLPSHFQGVKRKRRLAFMA